MTRFVGQIETFQNMFPGKVLIISYHEAVLGSHTTNSMHLAKRFFSVHNPFQ
jgi:hypothetical protein